MTTVNTLGGWADSSNSGLMFRNKLINGGFDIWQRGTSVTHSNNFEASTSFGPDRWRFSSVHDAVAYRSTTLSLESTNVPSLSQSAAKLTLNNSDCNRINLAQRLESSQSTIFASKSGVLSFAIRRIGTWNAATRLCANFSSANALDNFSSTTNRQTTSDILVSGLSSSDYTIITIPFNPNVNFKNGMQIDINLRTDNNDTPVQTTGDCFYISQVQLEAGSQATPFEQRPIGLELSLCQRYFEIIQKAGLDVGWPVMLGSSTLAEWQVSFKVEKRAAPTFWSSGAGNFGRIIGYTTAFALSSNSVTSASLGSGSSTSNANIGLTGTFSGNNVFNTFDTLGATRDIGVEAEL